jgi:hypothetical protein
VVNTTVQNLARNAMVEPVNAVQKNTNLLNLASNSALNSTTVQNQARKAIVELVYEMKNISWHNLLIWFSKLSGIWPGMLWLNLYLCRRAPTG